MKVKYVQSRRVTEVENTNPGAIMRIAGEVCISEPLSENITIDTAKYAFIHDNALIQDEWSQWIEDTICSSDENDYKMAKEAFYSKIKIIDTRFKVEVVNGWYKVTEVIMELRYNL